MLVEWPTGRLLSAVARAIEHEWNEHLAHWDLNHASLPVLFLLLGGPLSQRELAHASGVTEQTMSRIVARLERSAYVVREPHPDDARRHRVILTDAGRATVLAAGDPSVVEAMSERGLDRAQVDQLRALLRLMLDAHGTPVPDDVPVPFPTGHGQGATAPGHPHGRPADASADGPADGPPDGPPDDAPPPAG